MAVVAAVAAGTRERENRQVASRGSNREFTMTKATIDRYLISNSLKYNTERAN